MAPLQLSVSDSTSTSFDPLADLKRTFNQTNNIKSNVGGMGGLETYLPILLVVFVGFIVWKMFSK